MKKILLFLSIISVVKLSKQDYTGCGEFSRLYEQDMVAKTWEHTKPGKRIKTFDLSDIPAKYGKEYTIHIDQTKPREHLSDFRLDRIADKLYLVQLKEFDYEDTNQEKVIQLMLLCRVVSSSAEIDMILKVMIDDVNDHDPMFVNLPNTIYINEMTQIISPIYTITADDYDNNQNKKIYYSIETENEHFNLQTSMSGRLFLKHPMDYDDPKQKKIYNITIKAENSDAIPKRFTQSHLIVHVNDGDDLNPKFQSRVYKAQVRETPSVKQGEKLLSPVMIDSVDIVARDQDVGINQTIEFSLFNDTENADLFEIDSESARLRLVKSLDREVTSSIDLLVKATQSDDDQRYDVTLVQIDVTDVNDNVPIIHLLHHHVLLHENSKNGSYVTSANITDQDGNTGFTLDFIPSGFLTADPQTGEITVAENEIFDREIDEEFQFQIVATENETLERYRSQSVTLTIKILDDNDNNPTFINHQYNLHINESTPIGTSILQVNATDDDVSTEYSSVTYELVGNDDVIIMFDITQHGDVILSRGLDAEAMTSYRFKIEARDSGGRKDECEVEVQIDDVNDNPPQFVDDVINVVEISEAFQLNTTFSTIKAIDPDVNDTLVYSIRMNARDDDVISPFRVTNDGELQLIHGLDREEIPEYRIFVNVTDGIHVVEKEVKILVKDENDNAPIFVEKFYNFQLLYKSKDFNRLIAIGQVEARDMDIGRNSIVNYSMCYDESNFAVESETGQIFLISPQFDFRGKNGTFHFCVVATDSGFPPLTSYPVHVSVHVIREDYSPEARMLRESYHVTENVDRKQLVTSLEAKDGDVEVGFKLSHPALFEMISGEIWAKPNLDAEVLDAYYDVTIEIFDKQQPHKSTNTTITIYIDDVDDNPPYFLTDHYDVIIDEGTVTSSLIQLQITDDDRDDVNRNHVFKLIDDDVTRGLFNVDPDTGDLSNTRAFDYDVSRERYYNLTVIVESARNRDDDVSTSKPRKCDVTITIRDVNDNSPKFQPITGVESVCDDDVIADCYLYRMQFDEDAMVGLTGYFVNAEDLDDGMNGKVEFSIIRETTDDESKYYFDIDKETGELELLRSLDYENDDVTEYHLRVKVTDQGNPPKHNEASLLITINNINDNPPICDVTIFKFASEIVDETTKHVGRLQCHDNDGDDVIFRTTNRVSGNDENQISVIVDELTGDVYVSNAHRDAIVTYEVDVTDNKHNIPIQVEIKTTKCKKFDENLKFDRNIYNFRVKEDAKANSLVAMVPVLEKSTISSMKLIDPSNKLQLDDVTGEIRLRGNTTNLDYDDVTCNVITSCLNAFDQVGDVISAASVVINIDDVNDNPPVFTRDHYVINVKENSSPGEVLIKIEANDRDENSQLRYHINTDLLRIDDVTGVVTTATTFDREQQQQYNFTVTCDDSIHNSDVIMTLIIDDVNDNQPSFGIDEDHVLISTNQFHGDEIVIYSVKAFDADENDDVIYSLKENYDNLFSIHPLTGVVSMFKSQFSRNYDVIIEVRDRTDELLRHKQLHTSPPDDVMLLHVINDQDDSEAVKDGMFIAFLQKVHNIDIQIPVSAGLVVERLYVTNRSAVVVFFISTMSPLPFSIPDPRIGEIVTNRMLSRSASYEFVVQVEDACTGHVFDRAIVRINISLSDQRSALLTNHDIGIPYDSNIGYQISTKCDGKHVDIYNEEATKYFAYSPHDCNLVLVSSLVHLTNQTIQIMLYEEKGNVSQSIYCHVTGDSNELYLYINHSIDEIRTFDIVDSIQRCIGEEVRVGIVKILPLNDKKIRLNLFAYNNQHQLINASNFIRLFKEKCFSPEDERNQLFPLNVVGMESALAAKERQKQVKKPALEVAVASLAIVCGLLIFGFLLIGLIHFVNRERRKFENQQMNVYMDTSNPPLPQDDAVELSHLPPSNSFVPNNPDNEGEEPELKKKKMKIIGVFGNESNKSSPVSLKSFHSNKGSPISTRYSHDNRSFHDNRSSPASTRQSLPPDVVISDYQMKIENEKFETSSQFTPYQMKEIKTQQTVL